MPFVKQEVVHLCRICESTDKLIDISSEESNHLRRKLYSITNLEDKYTSFLKFICSTCVLKLENAFGFIKQCESTYRKFLEQIEDPSERDYCSEAGTENDELTDTKHKHKTSPEKIIKDNAIQSVEKKSTDSIKKEELNTMHRTFECHLCGKKFSAKTKLKFHIEGYHLKRKRYSCNICGAQFRYQSTMYKHKHIHSNETYSCDICGKIFKTKTYMKKHRNAHLVKRKPKAYLHLCHYCGQGSSSMHHHVEHLRIHTGTRAFKCEKCGKCFAQQQGLRVHWITHSDIRQFACHLCSSTFRKRSHLNSHIASHTGEKNFKCKACDKSYTTAGGLRIHMRLHTGEHPYQCPKCSTKFRLSKMLVSHRKKCTAGSESFRL